MFNMFKRTRDADGAEALVARLGDLGISPTDEQREIAAQAYLGVSRLQPFTARRYADACLQIPMHVCRSAPIETLLPSTTQSYRSARGASGAACSLRRCAEIPSRRFSATISAIVCYDLGDYPL